MSATKKTVFIAGSTRGIGFAFAQHYVNAGWKVIGTARASSNTDQLKALAPYKIVTMDMADEASILKAAQHLEGESIDLLVNNAGIALPMDFESITKDTMMKQFEVNAVGPTLVTRALLPNLKLAAETNGQAAVMQISSIVGSADFNMSESTGVFRTFPGYAASKSALNIVNVAISKALRESNVVAVAMHPGYVMTDIMGGQGMLKPSESVEAMAQIADTLTMSETGKFFSYDGKELAW